VTIITLLHIQERQAKLQKKADNKSWNVHHFNE